MKPKPSAILNRGVRKEINGAAILPWIALSLSAFGAGWALFVYTETAQIQRVRATLEFHSQYQDRFPAPGRELLGMADTEFISGVRQVQCERFREAVAAGDLPAQPHLPDRCDSLSGFDTAVLSLLAELASDDLSRDVERRIREAFPPRSEDLAVRLTTFFRAIKACVDAGVCDRPLTAELFLPDIIAFLRLTADLAVEHYYISEGRERLMEMICRDEPLLNLPRGSPQACVQPVTLRPGEVVTLRR